MCPSVFTASRAAVALLLAGSSLLPLGCQSASAAPEPPREVGCDGCLSLQGGMVFDGQRSGVGTVVIEREQVREVVFGEARVTAGEAVDMRGKTVLPGLIDLHVHLLSPAGPLGDMALVPRAEAHLKAMLRAGVTSYLDLGSPRSQIFEHRRRERANATLSPRTFAAGPLLTPTGGHPCYAGSPPGEFCVFVDSPAGAAAAISRVAPSQPDIVKIVIEAGHTKALPRLSRESAAALCTAGRAAGLGIIAHVSSQADVEDALDAGVRLFAHIPSEDRLSPAVAARMASLGAVVVPTMAVMDGYYRVSHGLVSELGDPALADDVPADVIAALRDPSRLTRMTRPEYRAMTAGWRANTVANMAVLKGAGVGLVTGTDAGNPGVFHGLAMARELSLFVAAGFTAEEALTAATSRAADVLGRADLGRLAPGSAADVLVVEGDALRDIRAISRVHRVYRAGAPIDRDALALPRGAPLSARPITGLTAGSTCLGAGECGAGLTCGEQGVCTRTCHGYTGCSKGSACFSQGAYSQGACYAGEGCDPLTQDCENGAACVPLGNGATACWTGGAARPGEKCSPGGMCVAGAACDIYSGRCKEICDPAVPGDSCPAGESCVDYSAAAGLTLGECE